MAPNQANAGELDGTTNAGALDFQLYLAFIVPILEDMAGLFN